MNSENGFLLIILMLGIGAQGLLWLSRAKVRAFYNKHRQLGHMTLAEVPLKSLVCWGLVGWVSLRLRDGLAILTIIMILVTLYSRTHP